MPKRTKARAELCRVEATSRDRIENRDDAPRVEVMLPDEARHAAHVEAWLDGAASKSLAPAQLVTLFDRALGDLWRRASVTLGEVTLMAIVDRVLYIASENYPVLSTLTVDETGICFNNFRQRVVPEDANLAEAVGFVLAEFLTVIGHLTDEILTPALHAELSRVALEGPGATGDNDVGSEGTLS